MIEMLGVLAIIGVLSAGGIMGYSRAMDNYRVNNWIDVMTKTVANAQNLFPKNRTTGGYGYAGIGTSDLCSVAIVPKDYCDSTSKNYLRPVFDDYRAANTSYRAVNFYVPMESDYICGKIISNNWQNVGSKLMFQGVRGINGSVLASYKNWDDTLTFDNAIQYCKTVSAGNYANAYWKMYFYLE